MMRKSFLFVGLVLSVSSGCVASSTNTRSAAPMPASALAADVRLLQMADARRGDTALLDSILLSPAESAHARSRRARAALLIGQLQWRDRYWLARRLLIDADTAVAASAAFALGLGRDTASLAALSRALDGAADGVAAEAAWSLGRIGEPARSAITTALRGYEDARAPAAESASSATSRSASSGGSPGTARGTSRGPAARAALLLAASVLRPVPTSDVIPYLRDSDAEVAFAAAYAIARPRAADGVRALLELSAHPYALVRIQVALGAAHNVAGDSLAAQATSVLRVLLSDADPRVRVQAVRSIASHTSLNGVRELVMARANDENAAVRITFAEVAAPLIRNDSVAWRTLFASDTTYMVRRALLDGALRNGLLKAELRSMRTHADPWYRAAAVDLSSVADSATPAITRTSWARADAAERVRAVAVAALSSGTDSAAVRDTVRSYLGDPSPAVRAAALGALVSRAGFDDVPLAMVRYSSDTASGQHAVRSAALRVIAAAWRRDSARFDERTRAQLAQMQPPVDPLLLRSVNAVTPLASWQGTERHLPQRSEYERIVKEWQHASGSVQAILRTVRGDITLELLVHDAPLTVENFVSLARRGYFAGTRFHRVIANFVAQDGDPTGSGSGSPGTSIRDELNRHRYSRGAVGMALSGPDTGGSQYFLTITPQPHLDGGYTVFARVIDGFDAMDALLAGDRLLEVVVPGVTR